MVRGETRLKQRLIRWIAVSAVIVTAILVWTIARKQSAPPLPPLPDVSTLTIDPAYCQKNSAVCERLCADCPDKKQCFASGGECLGGPAPAGTLQDQADRGPDIWMPGCHFQFQQAGCVNGAAWIGDWCLPDGIRIEEWINRVCHVAMGDHYTDDCDLKCKQLNLGPGKCVTVLNACGNGISSARCDCEKGNPTPTPPQNPT